MNDEVKPIPIPKPKPKEEVKVKRTRTKQHPVAGKPGTPAGRSKYHGKR